MARVPAAAVAPVVVDVPAVPVGRAVVVPVAAIAGVRAAPESHLPQQEGRRKAPFLFVAFVFNACCGTARKRQAAHFPALHRARRTRESCGFSREKRQPPVAADMPRAQGVCIGRTRLRALAYPVGSTLTMRPS